jgi:hypothetical protein
MTSFLHIIVLFAEKSKINTFYSDFIILIKIIISTKQTEKIKFKEIKIKNFNGYGLLEEVYFPDY